MHVTVAVQSWPSPQGSGPALTARDAADVVRVTWTGASPSSSVDAIAVGDGGPRSADAVEGSRFLAGGTEAVQTSAGVLLAPANAEHRWNPPALAAALLGLAAEASTSAPMTVVVPVGDEPPAGHAVDLWGGGLAAMRAALAPLTIRVLVGHSKPLLGFHGMSASLRNGREGDHAIAAAAQEQEQRWSTIAREADALAHRTTLVGSHRLSDAPGSGAGGGLAYCLGALGAQLTPASAVLLDLAGFTEVAKAADIVVAVTGEVTPTSLDHGVATPVAASAAAVALPCVVVAPGIHVGKRDLMAAGISGAHEAQPGVEGLREGIRRVARTWTPSTR